MQLLVLTVVGLGSICIIRTKLIIFLTLKYF